MNKKKGALAVIIATIIFLTGCGKNSKNNNSNNYNTTSSITYSNTYENDDYEEDENNNYQEQEIIIYEEDENNYYDEDYNNYGEISTVQELYDEATSEVSDLIKTIGFDNSIECFYFVDYLLSNGYLSLEDFSYDDNADFLDLYDYDALGADVLYGTGVCRHTADFYTNVLKKAGYDAYTSACYLTENKNDSTKKPNHAITVVNDCGVVYQDLAYDKEIYDKYVSGNCVTNEDKTIFVLPMNKFTNQDENIIVTHNDLDTINYIDSLFENDNEYVTSDAKKKCQDYVEKVIIYNDDNIEDFEQKYYDEVLSKLPEKQNVI